MDEYWQAVIESVAEDPLNLSRRLGFIRGLGKELAGLNVDEPRLAMGYAREVVEVLRVLVGDGLDGLQEGDGSQEEEDDSDQE